MSTPNLTDERGLIRFVCFKDLRDAGIVGNWQQLGRMIANEEFPVGRLLSPNRRAWRVDEIENWLASRPTERKITARLKGEKQRGRREEGADAIRYAERRADNEE